MHSNKYILTYIIGLSAIVALLLAMTYSGLKPIHDDNESLFKKRDILSAIRDKLPMDVATCSKEMLFDVFDNKVEQVVIDANGKVVEGKKADDIDMKQEEKKPEAERLYPIYIYTADDGKKYYLVAVRGNGLWDKIWGTIAIEDDFNTIAGVSFDHVTETAGLGAEIKDNPAFKDQFKGKKIFDENGNYVSVAVVKGGVKDPDHQVDAIAGATITSNGVTEMLKKGLAVYVPYFESLKKAKEKG
ncbi:MAG TPA: NADH:ubiquinone reductase (Na(+)-transporting) subunit C [Bacteroidetes bacterium]|nr:NADH:ubiquinone reductase (Na(+)-transporting) subunit C [Bacteroidota bacterium]